MNSVIYVGMDVHSNSFSLCAYHPETTKHSDEVTIPNDSKLIWKYANNLLAKSEPGTTLVFGYEAGCLGFTPANEIKEMGFTCKVMAPSTIRMSSSDRIRKTDRRDARALSEALGTNAFNEVHQPDQEDLDVRDFIRLREDTQSMVKMTKQRINAYLLKLGKKFDQGKSKWTLLHRSWLRTIELSPLQRETLDEYLTTLEELEAKVERYDERITQISNDDRYKKTADGLSCFKGITRPISMRIISEIGDFNRFETAGQFASYLGLTPCEHSSGDSEQKGGITKMGNSHVRKTLVEAAQSAIKGVPGRKSKHLKKRQEGNSGQVIHYADKGNVRIQSKFKKMMNSGKNRNIAVTACARELACFIWGMATNHIEDRVNPQRQPFDPITGEIYSV